MAKSSTLVVLPLFQAVTSDPSILRKMTDSVKQQFVQDTLELTHDERIETRLHATWLLGIFLFNVHFPDPAHQTALEALERMLGDADGDMRFESAMALAGIGNGNPLVRDILYDFVSTTDLEQEYFPVLDGATRLARLGDVRAIDILIKILASIGEYEKTRSFADIAEMLIDHTSQIDYSLSYLRSSQATDAMIIALNHDSDYVRRAMARALGCRTPRDVIDLLQVFADDESESVRDAAKESIAKFNNDLVVRRGIIL